jgi:hypothetical protein
VSDPRFARLPERLRRRRLLGEISFDEFGVMAELIARADHKTRVATFASIEILRVELGWHRKGQVRDESTLRKILRSLRASGEIEFANKQGRRGDLGDAWEIRILQADCFERPRSSEVTSDGTRSANGSNPHGMEDSDGEEPRTETPASEVAVDRDAAVAREIDAALAEPELSTASNDLETAADPLAALVAHVRDRDEQTLHTYRKNFGDVPRWMCRNALESLQKRRRKSDRPPLDSEAKYVYSRLADLTSLNVGA